MSSTYYDGIVNIQKQNVGKNDIRFLCSCNRTFREKKALTYHKRWECGQIHKCTYCDKEYKIIMSLKRHIKEVHLKHSKTKC